jgi:hypothetical protein
MSTEEKQILLTVKELATLMCIAETKAVRVPQNKIVSYVMERRDLFLPVATEVYELQQKGKFIV